MIDSSKKRNSLVGVEVLSPYVIERRSNAGQKVTATLQREWMTFVTANDLTAGHRENVT